MPTTVTKIVDPDNAGGTDYTSLSAWEAAQQADLVAADEIRVAECRSSSGTADTTRAVIAGWTTDSTRYPVVQSSGANKHSGTWDDAKYRLNVNTGFLESGLEIAQDYTRVIGIQSRVHTGTSHGGGAIYVSSGTGVKVSNCILRNNYTNASGNFVTHCLRVDSATVNAFNNLILSDTTSTGDQRNVACFGGTLTLENNTIINVSAAGTTYGLFRDTGTFVARNNLLKGHGNTATYSGTFAAGTDNNTTDSTDTIGEGSNNSTSQTFTFVNEAGGNYDLAAGDAGARNNGTTLAGVSSGFTVDLVGRARDASGAIDCGCFEFVGAAGFFGDEEGISYQFARRW